jgi:hypothetical protein
MGFCNAECVQWVTNSRREKSLVHVGLFHNGDELGHSPTTSSYRVFDFVFRNYYHPHIFGGSILGDKLVWVPNGARRDKGLPQLPEALVPASKRSKLCNFMGGIGLGNPDRSSARHEMRNALGKQGNPCDLEIVEESFGGKRTLWEHVSIRKLEKKKQDENDAWC